MPGPRYTSQNNVLADDLVEGVDRELALARRNLVLLLPDEALSQHDVLPLDHQNRRRWSHPRGGGSASAIRRAMAPLSRTLSPPKSCDI